MSGRVLSEADLRRKATEIANRFADADYDLPPEEVESGPAPVDPPWEPVCEPWAMDEEDRHWTARKLLKPFDAGQQDQRVRQAHAEECAAFFASTRRSDRDVVKRQFLEARKLIRASWGI